MTRTDRVLAVMRDKADGKQTDFAKAIGLSTGAFSESRTKGSWSIKAIDGILNRYPDISAEWLIRGEGDMYKPKKKSKWTFCGNNSAEEEDAIVQELDNEVIDDMTLPTASQKEMEEVSSQDGVPYYEEGFDCGFMECYRDGNYPAYYIRIKGMDNVDAFCDASGDSMAPLIDKGDVVALQKIDDPSYLPLGEIYGFEMKNGVTTIKRLRKGSSPDTYVLEPLNTEEYDSEEIPRSLIKPDRVFKVVGCLKRF